VAVTAWWYVNAFETMLDKQIDWISDDIAASLHTVSYVPNQDTHDFFDDLTNQLSTANGYTAEDGTGTGKLLAGKGHTNTLNVSSLDADNLVWTSTGAGFASRILVLSDVTTNTTTTDPLILWVDFGQTETASGGGTLTIDWSGSDIVATITAADATGFP
jgi:hypothetical protein